MPLFNKHGPDCANQVIIFTIALVAIVAFIALVAFAVLGIYVSVALIVLSAIILRYVIDQYGDRVFTDSKYYMSKKDIEMFGKTKIPLVSD